MPRKKTPARVKYANGTTYTDSKGRTHKRTSAKGTRAVTRIVRVVRARNKLKKSKYPQSMGMPRQKVRKGIAWIIVGAILN